MCADNLIEVVNDTVKIENTVNSKGKPFELNGKLKNFVFSLMATLVIVLTDCMAISDLNWGVIGG